MSDLIENSSRLLVVSSALHSGYYDLLEQYQSQHVMASGLVALLLRSRVVVADSGHLHPKVSKVDQQHLLFTSIPHNHT
jgi:hypothetical protein